MVVLFCVFNWLNVSLTFFYKYFDIFCCPANFCLIFVQQMFLFLVFLQNIAHPPPSSDVCAAASRNWKCGAVVERARKNSAFHHHHQHENGLGLFV